MTDRHDDACGSQACQLPAVESGATSGIAFRIATLDCPTEDAEIRRAVEAIDGVHTSACRHRDACQPGSHVEGSGAAPLAAVTHRASPATTL
jgi:hypothetical protein